MNDNRSQKQVLIREDCVDRTLTEGQMLERKEEVKEKYRQELEEMVDTNQGELSALDLKILEMLRVNIGLSPEEAFTIKNEVLTPYREYNKKLQEYRQSFIAAIRQEPVIRRETRNGLKRLQELLGLREEDAIAIETRILQKRKGAEGNSILVLVSLVSMILIAGIGSWVAVSLLNPVWQEQTSKNSAVSQGWRE